MSEGKDIILVADYHAENIAFRWLNQATGEERIVDGVRIQFQFTPDAEAPAEMMFYFPELKALCTSEVVTHILHNVYTPRGAKVRDALAWAKYIHELMLIPFNKALLNVSSVLQS